ncbi:MAG TPA: 3D-(3,5/4)-trihydroxycyclohexane-1,2-dione acylhydrolase (decyclizing) [Steroidobacteraceae bacterium]|nr:3D-(3,5/4)-trihydroxycyclohexane-1,2-dione acylhydrolase (decyclizing) [Steroidobacteraceae bacterium]
MKTVRLTMAQALVRHLAAQRIRTAGGSEPLFHGVFAIFGHGNVAGLGEALAASRDALPTFRAHNEQAMAHAAIAFAKANRRRRMMACTTSIGPGATNMVTAAALAHVNRLPVLLLPGDVFAGRQPDPVLQQLEDFGDPTRSVNDCFRPVSRYWDRLTRPEQLLASLPQALAVLLDPADCGPVTLALPQDVQAEAFDYPAAFFEERVHDIERPRADRARLGEAVRRLKAARRPLIVAGGGVHYAVAEEALAVFASRHGIPVAETQAGKSALAHDHPCNVGGLGVTGSAAANALLAECDLLLALGTRLQDFTTGSGKLVRGDDARLVSVNVARHDAIKRGGLAVRGDLLATLEELEAPLAGWASEPAWREKTKSLMADWNRAVDHATRAAQGLPTDAQVLGAVNRALGRDATVVCAAGGLPGELHKLWRCAEPGCYHLEYGYSCMGYEIAGGLGVKMADPARTVAVLVGDGSYLMMNSEIATSVASGNPLLVVLADNRGFGCIHRLQRATAGATHNNLLPDSFPADTRVDFVAHAKALGAEAMQVAGVAELEAAVAKAKSAARTTVIVIETDPQAGTAAGGAWWNVPVAEVSPDARVREAHAAWRRAVDEDPEGQ